MSRRLKVSAAQLGPIHRADSRKSVVSRLVEMLKEADSRGSKFVVFPELALTTFFPRWWMEDQAEVDGYFEAQMPSPETLEAFIARVVSGAFAEAIEQFYTPDSTMQENQSPPRVGRDANAANERRVLAKLRSVHTTCVRPVLVNGDHVVIRWIFRSERPDGTVVRIEELAWQRWEGERIAEETFFYDPAQLVPQAPR